MLRAPEGNELGLHNGPRQGVRDRQWHREVFGDNYFIEIQRNGTEGQGEQPGPREAGATSSCR